MKLANYRTVNETVTVKIPAAIVADVAALTVFTGGPLVSNSPLDAVLAPVSSTVIGSATGGWTFVVPGYGIAVLTASQ